VFCFLLALVVAFAHVASQAIDDNLFTVKLDPPPVVGKPFIITWMPTDHALII